jgi:peptidoglycan/xylan/chitin deacetylase (PgdA/CDA1 family)
VSPTELWRLLKNTDLFDIFVAEQEYKGQKDRYGRFLFNFSANKSIMKPIVSDYLVENGLINVEWPDNHRFAACLTHDVDTIYPSWNYVLFTSVKYALRLRPSESLWRLRGRNRRDYRFNPYWNFREILALEESLDAKSSFYFKTAAQDPVGWTYSIEDARDELRYMTDRGWEVGLHGGFFSYNNPEELKAEKKRLENALGKEVVGIRMHYLRFDVPDTWRLLARIGFKYDTTFGYPDMPGFRNGMCHPFKPYDLHMKEEVGILEIPLIIMDGCLLKMSIYDAWEIIKNLVDVTEKNRGVVTILWHNNTFDQIFFGPWARLYEKILQLLKNKGAWTTSAEELCDYWIKTLDYC